MKTKPAPQAIVLCCLLLTAVFVPDAKADLIYENLGGASLLFDTATGTTWTQDANISCTNFGYQDALSWANSLTLGGLYWTLPTAAQFTSLFTDLDPYGAPGVEGDKYGAQVFFGPGPNDYASLVQPTYWTGADGIDFNFYYGYAGNQSDTSQFAAWAVVVPTPEPASLLLLLAGAVVVGFSLKMAGTSPQPAVSNPNARPPRAGTQLVLHRDHVVRATQSHLPPRPRSAREE